MVTGERDLLREEGSENVFSDIGGRGLDQRPYARETMHSALNLKCTIRAQLISATRGHASQPKVLAMAADCSATCQ